MKIYRSHDAIAPIVVNLQTTEDPGGMNPWFVGLGLIGAAIALCWPNSPFVGTGGVTGEPLIDKSIVFGFGLALALVGVSILSRRIPALARFGSRHRMMIIVGFMVAITMTFGPLILLAFAPGARMFGMIIIAAFIINFGIIPIWILQRRNARRIAAEMREAAAAGLATPPMAPAATEAPASPGELVIELYETDDLPAAGVLREQVTIDANIAGRPPCRFLHLYNFFADAISAKPRHLSAWRLHGPVMMLASPLELARAAGYNLQLPEAIEGQLLSTPALMETRVAAMNDAPRLRSVSESGWAQRLLDRGKRNLQRWLNIRTSDELPELFRKCGAYPEEVLLCTDQTWQAGVLALTNRAHKAIMDASDFNAERRGLVWEIQHLLNRFAVQDVVVLVNSFTDLPALGEEFRRAWKNMPARSPNNHPAEAQLRIVLLAGDDRGGWDDDSALGGRSQEIRDAERIAAHHRVVELLRGEEVRDRSNALRGDAATGHVVAALPN